MNKDIPIGSIVKLSKDTRWDIGKNNPLDCHGTVFDQHGWTIVDWENGGHNAYRGMDSDLIIQEPEQE